MVEESRIDQRRSEVRGTQTNIAGDAQAPVFSGQFQIQGDFIYNPATKLRLPLQRPPRVHHFAGREDELTSLLKDLQPGRAVTICGPGGMGKTALAAEAIWRLAPANEPPQIFPDGIIFHTFYHKPQAARALEAAARAYGEDPRQDPLEAARRALAGRQALLVLDGTEACEDLEAVLSVTASCGVLITTRRHSDAPADFSDLPPLPQDKAVQLLQAWGGKMASDVSICQSICSLIGGLPLAVFLVGRYMAQRRQLGGEYLAWLEKTPLIALDLGERQHLSIPLLMKHSLMQVSDLARDCLGVTGVLALRPFEPEIIAVALQISAEDANLNLGELVDFGLLTRPDVRYQMTHALAHAYAREKLPPPSNALARLAKYYNEFIHKQMPFGLAGYALLDAQRDHIIAVQSACSKAKMWKAVRRITKCIEDYLDQQGHRTEWVDVLQAGLEAARYDKAIHDEGRFLNLLGLAYVSLGDARRAIECHQQAASIFSKIGEKIGEGAALCNLGNAYASLGDWDRAMACYRETSTICEGLGYTYGGAIAQNNLGNICYRRGEWTTALDFYDLSLEGFVMERNLQSQASVYSNVASIAYNRGDWSRALQCYNRSLDLFEELEDQSGMARVLSNLGTFYNRRGERDLALEHFRRGLEVMVKQGDIEGAAEMQSNIDLIRTSSGGILASVDDYKKQLQQLKAAGDIGGQAEVLGAIGSAYADRYRWDRALSSYSESLALFEELGEVYNQSQTIFNMALIHKNRGEWGKSAQMFQRCLDIFENLGARPNIALAKVNLGSIRSRSGQDRQAEKLIAEGLSTLEDLGAAPDLCEGYLAAAEAKLRSGLFMEARFYLSEAETLIYRMDYQPMAIQLHNLWGEFYQGRASYIEAKNNYEKALKIACKIGDRRGEGTALFDMSLALDSLGERVQAVKLAKDAMAIYKEIESPYEERVRRKLAEWRG